MKSHFRMVDVGAKLPTLRRALASGRITMGRGALALVKAGRLPKGDVLKLAEAAGLYAAKQTPALLPLCHPLPLDEIKVWLAPEGRGVAAWCEVSAAAKTGVEMEALAGVSGALLCVYDLVKQVDPDLTIGPIRLESKEGGKSELVRRKGGRLVQQDARPLKGLRAAVITVSDRASRGRAADRSGPALVEGLKALGLGVRGPRVVPDERPLIEKAVRAASSADVVVLTGGTGLSPRDVTPEAVEAVCERLVPGFGEQLRSQSSNPMAPLSRSVAGQCGRALVVALPGSRGAVAEGLRILQRLLPHALEVARGGDHGGVR